MLWTLFIFVGCLMPGKDLPKVDAPFIDKWVHLVMFGGFTFLWLLAGSGIRASRLLTWLIVGIALGGLIEFLQGILPSLGRSCEFLDIVADGLGALLGIALYRLVFSLTNRTPS